MRVSTAGPVIFTNQITHAQLLLRINTVMLRHFWLCEVFALVVWYAQRRIWLWINLRSRPLRLKLWWSKNRHTYTKLQVFPSRSSALLIKHHCINILWCHAFLHYLLIRSWHALHRTLCSLYLLILDFLIRNVCRLMGILWWMSVLIAVLTGSNYIWLTYNNDWDLILKIST